MVTDLSDYSQGPPHNVIAQGVPVNAVPVNAMRIPRDVRTIPQHFEIDQGPNFPSGYDDDFEYRNGLGFCCCTIPQLISCMCFCSGFALLLGVWELYTLISVMSLIDKGEDISLWLPDKNSFMAKYAEAEQNESVQTHGSLKSLAVLIIIVTIFAIICRAFVCYYLYPIAINNARSVKDRK